MGQQEAQERRTNQQTKDKARQRKQERQQIQRDAWVQVAEYPDHWSRALSLTPRDETAHTRGEPQGATNDLTAVPRAEGQDAEEPLRGDVEMTPQGDEAVVRQWGSSQQQPRDANAECQMDSDDCWSPACTHMSDNEDRNLAGGAGIPTGTVRRGIRTRFLGGCQDPCLAGWIRDPGTSRICSVRPREFPNVSQPVVGA